MHATSTASTSDQLQWLTLGAARAMLGINEATLRHWADQGLVRVFRTPGGHRRFALDEVRALLLNANGHPAAMPAVNQRAVLPRIRRLAARQRPAPPAWLDALDEPAHRRLRAMGRELLELCLGVVRTRPGRGTAGAAERLGGAYGVELAKRGVPMRDAVEAFVFFRDTTLEAVAPSLTRRGTSPKQVGQSWQRMSKLTDRALVGLAAAYGSAAGGHAH